MLSLPTLLTFIRLNNYIVTESASQTYQDLSAFLLEYCPLAIDSPNQQTEKLAVDFCNFVIFNVFA